MATTEAHEHQAIRDRRDPAKAAELQAACVARMRAGMLRRSIVSNLIALGLEPDEPTIGRIFDEFAPFVVLDHGLSGLALIDITGHPADEPVRDHLIVHELHRETPQ